MNVGFIHGVMNTDNMTISGETIDYGPCAFMEAYDPATVFSSIDHGGRYAYANQPLIARWNLARLAEALLPLMADGDDEAAVQAAVAEVTEVSTRSRRCTPRRCCRASAPSSACSTADDDSGDARAGRRLAGAAAAARRGLHAGLAPPGRRGRGRCQALARAVRASRAALNAWLERWRARCAQDDGGDGAPPGPCRAHAAGQPVDHPAQPPRRGGAGGGLGARRPGARSNSLLAALRRPFDEDPALARYAQPAPAQVTAGYQTFCGGPRVAPASDTRGVDARAPKDPRCTQAT